MLRLILPDDAMPRTAYWDHFLGAITRCSAGLRDSRDLLVPAEDIVSETNWPAYGNQAAAFTRGTLQDWEDGHTLNDYLNRVIEVAKNNPATRLLVVNMHPRFSMALHLRHLDTVFVADGNLVEYERALNPRTISIPALPIATGTAPALASRDILASFQGLASHSIRQGLAAMADGKKIVVNLVDGSTYAGRVNALTQARDREYGELLGRSIFAFVPRGDANFSYRLLEVMSFGCIPVILSDGWVLPFDRSLQWNTFSLRVSADAVPMIPGILESLSGQELSARFAEVKRTYDVHFRNLDCIVRTLFRELNTL
jgi:hypothetical protein